MATKRRRHLAVDASNFVTVQHVRENHTFSVIAKVMSKSGVMKFDCLYSYLFCVFFSSALMEFLRLCLQWLFTQSFVHLKCALSHTKDMSKRNYLGMG